MRSLKIWCYISAAAYFIVSLFLCIGCILVCVWYDNPEKLNTMFSVRYNARWEWVLLSVVMAFACASVLVLIKGVMNENKDYIKIFLKISTIIVFVGVVDTFSTMCRQASNQFPGSTVASEFFSRMALIGLLLLVQTPSLIMYKKLSGHSYFEDEILCLFCCKCLRKKSERLPTETA